MCQIFLKGRIATHTKLTNKDCYLATRLTRILGEGKHIDLKAFDVRGEVDPGVSYHRMEDHTVWITGVLTAASVERGTKLVTRKRCKPQPPCVRSLVVVS